MICLFDNFLDSGRMFSPTSCFLVTPYVMCAQAIYNNFFFVEVVALICVVLLVSIGELVDH